MSEWDKSAIFTSKVGWETLRNWLNQVQDLIQDISWEKGQHNDNELISN